MVNGIKEIVTSFKSTQIQPGICDEDGENIGTETFGIDRTEL